MNKVFKDRCDICNEMKVCRGFKGLVLCEECEKKEAAKPPEIVGEKDEQTRFDI